MSTRWIEGWTDPDTIIDEIEEKLIRLWDLDLLQRASLGEIIQEAVDNLESIDKMEDLHTACSPLHDKRATKADYREALEEVHKQICYLETSSHPTYHCLQPGVIDE